MNFEDRDPIIRNYMGDLQQLTDRLVSLPAEQDLGTELLRRLFTISVSPKFAQFAEQIAKRMAVGIARANANSWREAAAQSMRGRQIYESLQREMSGPLGMAVRQIVNQNATLIRSLPETLARQTAHYIAEQQQAGIRSDEIAEVLRLKLPELASNKIRLIARTEVAKADTAVTRARAERLGLEWYEWTTSDDQRVRKSHKKLDGVLVSWDDPPSPERMAGEKSSLGNYHAGNAPNCRCLALPLVEMAEVRWPHKVYLRGRIDYMTRWEFLQIGLPKAA